MGPASNLVFSTNVTVSPYTPYYYACYASNIYGDAWAPVTNFTSMAVAHIWTGASDTNWNNSANWTGGAVPANNEAVVVTNTASADDGARDISGQPVSMRPSMSAMAPSSRVKATRTRSTPIPGALRHHLTGQE